MPVALMNDQRQALQADGVGQVVDCSDCCNPVTTVEYFYRSEPCHTFPAPCALGSISPVYLSANSTLTDDPRTIRVRDGLGVAGEPDPAELPGTFFIRVGGYCYEVVHASNQRYASVDTPGFLIIPDGAIKVGGTDVEIERRNDCDSGCADVDQGPEYFECFLCSGCPTNTRYFTCARLAQGYSVIYDLFLSVVLCIDRTIGYTAEEVQQIPGSDVQIIDEPVPLTVWTGGGTDPRLLPAPSCCFWPGVGDCNASDCLNTDDWQQFGGDTNRWFPVAKCCGSRDSLLYRVSFAFIRTQVQDLGGGDLVTNSTTASVDTVTNSGGTISINLTITQRTTRPSQGIDIITTSPATITMQGECCLSNADGMPRMDRFDVNGTAIPDAQGFFYYTRSLIAYNAETSRRQAWNTSPWGLPFQLASFDGASSVSSTGSSDGSRLCDTFNFQHTESVMYGSGVSVDVYINLTVSVIPDNSFPCSYGGSCGSSGWGTGLRGMLP